MLNENHRPASRWALAGTISAIVALLGAAACGPRDTKTTPKAGKRRGAGMGRKLTDTAIRLAVEKEILFDQAVDLNPIAVEVNEGVVELTGQVLSLLAKQRAARVAQTVKGVRAVINRIEVAPMERRSESAIREDVSEALIKDPATRKYQVTVSVEDQVVELAGSVSSWQQRKLAEKVAASVAGVKGVENDILVRYEEKRQDAQIKDEIQKALRWDALVDHALIDVEVEGGKVELKGKVGSAAEKMRAKADAWVAGVSSVTIKNLQVVDWARNERLRKSKYVVKSDSAIRDAVKDALIYDPRVFSFKITPSVEDGTVTLSGTVDNIKAKRAAEQVARNTVGVFQVRNLIRIKTTKPSEAEIRANLESALAKDPYLEDDEIEPKVSNTTVELEGNVDTYYEKGRADDIAAKAYGVTSIENNLTVRNGKTPLSYDPYLADYYIYDTGWYDYQPFYTFEPDSEIRAEVQDELWWSPFVDAQDVEVEVDDGIVTLSGTVDTIGEWRVATQEAYEGGATWVRNQLRVE